MVVQLYRTAKGLCFVEGTLVSTEDGLKKIEDIEPGDLVLSREGETGVQSYQRVVQTFVSHPTKLVHLRYRSGSERDDKLLELVGTPSHPFWSEDKQGWIGMGELRPDEKLRLNNGSMAIVVSTEIEKALEGQTFTTYNFEVEGTHTYFVAPKGSLACVGTVWVHNACGGKAAKPLPTVKFSAAKNPDLAANIKNAQQAGHPKILTHGGNYDANRKAALREVPKISGFTRDEYPFASSMEGGEGSWVGHVPASQQSSQGGILMNFFSKNKLKPGDKYRVEVTK